MRATQGTLLSLQKGFGSEQLAHCSFRDRFVRCQEQVDQAWDFLETAAIIINCDLVITSDTSVAHLAAGLGKTIWLLLKQVPEWRWGLGGERSFWYPSLRLFRQHERGNWDEVLARVAEALRTDPTLLPALPVASEACLRAGDAQAILAPISLAELMERIASLQIQAQQVSGPALDQVMNERQRLETILANLSITIDPSLIQGLQEVTQDLWRLRQAIREQERQRSFGDTFLHLARSLFEQQDRCAAIKEAINATLARGDVEAISAPEA